MVNATKYSAVNLLPELKIDSKRWNRMPSGSEIDKTARTIEEKGNINVIRVPDGNAALAKIKKIIPEGAEVMNGSSTTLMEIGYLDLLNRGRAWPFAAKNLVLVSGVNKIVPTLSDALQRVMEYACPLEDARAKKAQGTPSWIGKCVILANEKQTGRVTLILINECLGY